MQRARPQLSLKGRALRYLSQREHSRSELERKLARHAGDPAEIARVLDDLQVRGFIDHQRVAESVVNRRSGKLGAMRIRQELQAIGIEPLHVATVVEHLRATELQRAQDVWSRKFRTLATDAEGRARQARFLAARGFASEIVRKVVLGCDDELQ